MHCLLQSLILCAALRARPVVALTAAHAGALIADGLTTRRALAQGRPEADPIARALVGSRPTWGRMIPVGAAFAVGQMYLSERMRRSQNPFLRTVWWIPQSVSIHVSVALAATN